MSTMWRTSTSNSWHWRYPTYFAASALGISKRSRKSGANSRNTKIFKYIAFETDLSLPRRTSLWMRESRAPIFSVKSSWPLWTKREKRTKIIWTTSTTFSMSWVGKLMEPSPEQQSSTPTWLNWCLTSAKNSIKTPRFSGLWTPV